MEFVSFKIYFTRYQKKVTTIVEKEWGIWEWKECGIFRYRPRGEQLKREKMFDSEKQKMSKLRFAERLEIEVNDEVSDSSFQEIAFPWSLKIYWSAVLNVVDDFVPVDRMISINTNIKMASEIDRCYATQVRANDNLHVSSLIFRDWGRDRIKECGCSPDAFIQMAMQLANYRVSIYHISNNHLRVQVQELLILQGHHGHSLVVFCNWYSLRIKAVSRSLTKRHRLDSIAIRARKRWGRSLTTRASLWGLWRIMT